MERVTVNHIHNNQDGPLTGPGPTSPPLGAGAAALDPETFSAGVTIADPLLISIIFEE